jgi:hypothetical protein
LKQVDTPIGEPGEGMQQSWSNPCRLAGAGRRLNDRQRMLLDRLDNFLESAIDR